LKTYDLTRKFGWTIMPWLSNLGVNLLADSNVFFVDNEHSSASNVEDTIHGNSFEQPYSTLNYAISKCTDDQGDVILIAPGHTETIADAGTASGATTDELVLDKSGVTIIGLGTDALRPTFTFNGATDASLVVTVANCTIRNLIFVGGLADLATLVDVAGTGDGLRFEGCEFRDGGTAILETIHQIDLATGCHRVTINNCRFLTFAAGSSTLSNIEVATGVNLLTVTNCWFRGDVNTDGMLDGSGGAGTDWYIVDNNWDNLDAATGKCIVLNASTTGLVLRNIAHGANEGVSPFTIAGVVPAQNYYTNVEGASAGILDPGTDS